MGEYQDYLEREPRLLEGKKLKIVAWVLTAVVLVLGGCYGD